MGLDGITLAAIRSELEDKLIGGRVDKIYQPKSELLTIRVRQPGENLNLLLSANPQGPRVHLTNESFDNPAQPPAFCMLLRKHLQSGRIRKVEQPNFERILNIVIQYKDEQGQLIDKNLVIELMGRHSNVILVDHKNKILDSIKRVTDKMSRQREVLPNKTYSPPPEQGKKNPLNHTAQEFKTLLEEHFDSQSYKAIMNSYRGIGPLMAKEISYRANIDPYDKITSPQDIEALYKPFSLIFNNIINNKFNPTIVMKGEEFKNFSSLELKQFDLETKEFSSISKLMDLYYKEKILRKKKQKLTEKMLSVISSNKKKAYKKYRKVNGQLKGALSSDKYKLKGELITANIYRLKEGDTQATLENYYDNNKKIKIKLDPRLTPAENAQRYFKKYEKAKRSIKHLKNQVRKGKNEINYLKQLELSIEHSQELDDLIEIYEELIDEGYIKKQKKGSKKQDRKLLPLTFKSSDGYQILVGRNNKQNDHLTKKVANDGDTWLHVKDIPGSHTIIRNHTRDEIPDSTLLEAAQIAAYYSKGRESSKVPVDYTLTKYVNKPKGAKPGMVYYDNHKTLYVEPKEELIKSLKNKKA